MIIKTKTRRGTLPESLICSQAEAIDLLGRRVFDDARGAGWLQPCAARKTKFAEAEIYAVADVQLVARRITTGEYPEPKTDRASKVLGKKARGGVAREFTAMTR